MVISGRFNPDDINRKITRYFELYVICKECKKPDTKLVQAEKGLYLVCEACGARYWIKSRYLIRWRSGNLIMTLGAEQRPKPRQRCRSLAS